jgi:Sulfotransferase domain
MYPDFKNVGHIFYQVFNDEIQRIVPRDPLLMYDVKEGWKPLCDFLGKETPAHPFPETNERAVLAANVSIMKATTEVEIHKMWRPAGLIGALEVACVGVIYAYMLRLW